MIGGAVRWSRRRRLRVHKATLRLEPEAFRLASTDEVWESTVVMCRKLHLAVADPFQLSKELLKHHLVRPISKWLVCGVPGVGGGQVLNQEGEQQLRLMRLGEKGEDVKGEGDLADCGVGR